MVDGRYFVTEGAPDPLACTKDDECIGDTVVEPDGCCVGSSAAYPQTWAWHTWLSKRRTSPECKKVTCPPLPPPSPPPKCAMQCSCVQGRCKNSCPSK
jgi:hypothetical protein